MRNKNHDDTTSKQISAESQHIHDKWVNNNYYTISQITITIWYVKNHFMIFAITNEITADDVSELHVIIHKAADNADMQRKKQIK